MIDSILFAVGADRLYRTLFGIIVLTTTIPAAVGSYWLLLRAMDWALGIKFREEFKKFSPTARANYFGKRNIGVAIVIGCVFLRFL